MSEYQEEALNIQPDTGGRVPGAPGETARNDKLVDLFARSITYLRVSLTDHCNLRCIYCTPKGEQEKLLTSELLTYEELLRVIALAVESGINKIRLTGGEPLVRRDIVYFVEQLAAIPGLEDIRLTTNGVFLTKYAESLFNAGIKKINVSLDTLQRDKYKQITGSDCFEKVWQGIECIDDLGFQPIKINMVVLKGTNDDELVDFAKLSLNRPYQIRFIEFMPVGRASSWEKSKYMAATEIMDRLSLVGELVPVQQNSKDGPAKIYRLNGGLGTLGFISPISGHFCDRCNRLRLTSEGKLRSCLLNDQEVDLKRVLREGGSDADIKKVLVDTVLNKPKGHDLDKGKYSNCHGRMSRIGG
jgi:cyclic pyranopterin phosphate synthase